MRDALTSGLSSVATFLPELLDRSACVRTLRTPPGTVDVDRTDR